MSGFRFPRARIRVFMPAATYSRPGKRGRAVGGAGVPTEDPLFCPKSENGLSARWPWHRLFENVCSPRGSAPVNKSYARPFRQAAHRPAGVAPACPTHRSDRGPACRCGSRPPAVRSELHGEPPAPSPGHVPSSPRPRSERPPAAPGQDFILARRSARRCHLSRRLRLPRGRRLQAQDNAHPGRRSAPSGPPATRCCR